MGNGTIGNGSSTVFALVMLATIALFVAGAIIGVISDPADAGLIIAAFLGALAVTLPSEATFLTGLNTAKLAAQTAAKVSTVEAKVDATSKQMDGVLTMARQGAADAATKDEMVAQRDREAASLAASDTTTTTNTTTTSAATPAPPFTVYAPPLPVETPPVEKPGEGDTTSSSSAIITTTPAAELTITPIADPKLPPENGVGKE